MSEPTDNDIEVNRVAGDITLVLNGDDSAKRESLLRAIETLCGKETADELRNN